MNIRYSEQLALAHLQKSALKMWLQSASNIYAYVEEKSSALEHEPKKLWDEENESFSNMENNSEKEY